MINLKNIALIYAFDLPHTVNLSDNVTEYRFYDEEFLKSVRHWRKNAGWLKDIQIYALAFDNINKYNQNIINELKNLNVSIQIAEIDLPKNDPWLKCVYAGKFFESTLNEQILIRLDLDMYCLKPLPEDWFLQLDNYILIGAYDKRNSLNSRQIYYNNTTFDISLIISNKKFSFYEKYYNQYIDPTTFNTHEWKTYISKNKNFFHGYIGEYVIDYMNNNSMINIMPITNHYFGEGYRDISFYTSEEVKKICFLHEHIRKNTKYYDNYNPIRSMLTYIKKLKNG